MQLVAVLHNYFRSKPERWDSLAVIGKRCFSAKVSAFVSKLSQEAIGSFTLCGTRSSALALRDASPKRVHQVDDTGRRHSRRFGFLGQASLFPLQKLDHCALKTILEFRGIELSRLRIDDVLGELQHVLG